MKNAHFFYLLFILVIPIMSACNADRQDDTVVDAVPSQVTTIEDQAVSFRAFRNPQELSQLVDFQHTVFGELTDNGDATFTYQPKANFNGEDGLAYALNNGEVRIINITVTQVDDPPIAQTDIVFTQQNQPVTVDPLANDRDVEFSALSITQIEPSLGGTFELLEIPNTGYLFTPHLDYSGFEQIHYTVSDGSQSSQGTIKLFVFGPQISITGINIEPVDPILSIDQSSQLGAYAHLSGDEVVDVTQLVTWRIADATILSIGDEHGTIKATAIGQTEVRANYANFSAAVQVSVTGRVPAKPRNPTAVAGVESILLNWAESRGAQSYNLYVNTADATTRVIANAMPPFRHTPLPAQQRYRYRITALNEFGESELSEWALATTLAGSKSAAVQIAASAVSQPGQIQVSWNVQQDIHYKIDWSDRAITDKFAPLGSQTEISSPFLFQQGEHEQTYYFRLSALNQTNEMMDAEIVSAEFQRAAPTQPSIERIDAQDGGLLIYFSSNDHYSYTLHWMEGSSFDLQRSIEITNVSSPYQHKPLVNGLVYHYQLTANDNYLKSLPSPSVSASPQAVSTNQIPQARNPTIGDNNAGTIRVGVTLTALYEYFDVDGDEQDPAQTTVQWYRGLDAIASAQSVNYIVANQDSGQSVHYEVTPVALSGVNPGITVVSPNIDVPANSPLGATNIDTAESFTEDDAAFSLAAMVVTDLDNDTITATLTLSDLNSGLLSTATVGQTSSSFLNGQWRASGSVVDINGLLSSVQFVPAMNYAQNFTIDVAINDGVFPALTGSKAVTVTAMPDPPVIDQGPSIVVNMDEDGVPLAFSVVLTVSDPDIGDRALWSANPSPQHGNLQNAIQYGNQWTGSYSPAYNWFGQDTFTLQVRDDSQLVDTIVVTVNVAAQNDPPSISLADETSFAGDRYKRIYRATDVENNPFVYSATGLPPGLVLDSQTGKLEGTISIGAAANSPYNVNVVLDEQNGVMSMNQFIWTVNAPLTSALGERETQFGDSSGVGYDVKVLPNGRIITAGDMLYNSVVTAHTSGGEYSPYNRDTSFGDDDGSGNGTRTGYTDMAGDPAIGRSLVFDASNRILVAGYVTGTSTDMAVWAFSQDGVLDSGFGQGGVLRIPSTTNEYGYGAAMDNNGRIVVVGNSFNGTDTDMMIWRVTAQGSLDTAFGGGNGYIRYNISNDDESAAAVLVDSANRILVAGNTKPKQNSSDAMIWRYTDSGSGYVLDTAFGAAGLKTGTLRIDNGNIDEAFDLVLDNSGHVLISGKSNFVDFRDELMLWSVFTNGAQAGELDTGFGTAGVARFDTPGFITSGHDIGYALTLDNNNSIVVGGSCCKTTANSIGPDILVVRFTSAGIIDTTFGDIDQNTGVRKGYTRFQYSNVQVTPSYVYGITTDAANRIITVGRILNRFR